MTGSARLVALFLALGVVVARPGDAAAFNDVSASNCALAAGRDAQNNTITCNYGLTPEQVQELTKAAAAGAVGPLADRIVDLSKQLGITEGATKKLLLLVGEQDVPLDKLPEKLAQVAADYKRLQTQVAALNPDNPVARDLVERAKAKIVAGDFSEAHRLLHEAQQAQVAAAQEAKKLREQAQAAEDAQLLGAAAAASAEGDLALTESHYTEAADLFRQAAELVPAGHAVEATGYLSRQADALQRQGDEHGDNPALQQAIATWRAVLGRYDRTRAPLQWAATQNNLGIALRTLGERESGTRASRRRWRRIARRWRNTRASGCRSTGR